MRILQWSVGVAALALCAVPAMAQQSIQTAFNYNLADDAAGATTANEEPAADAPKADCGCEQSASCGCDPSYGCNGGCGCDSGGLGNCLSDDCCLGDPCTLQEHMNQECCTTKYGGWLSAGYYSDNVGLSRERGDLRDYRDVPDNLNLDQAWLFVERKAKGSACSSDWGYRYDIMYGVDAQKLQAFGNENNGWDRSFDNGVYGWAMPQAYLEAAYGDWSIIAGKFISPLGYEAVQAPDSFFYTHSLSFFNSEPFTHTGVLATYRLSDTFKLINGWTLGWDTGFDQFGGGSNYIGGFEHTSCDEDVSFAYFLTAGNLGFRSGNRNGYSHTAYVDVMVTAKLEYAFYTAYVNTDGSFGDPNDELENFDITNYLYYHMSDCWSAGGRFEWWKGSQVSGENTSFYELTGGLNYRPHANVIIRPEVRYDWTPSEQALNDSQYNRALFGINGTVTF